MRKDSQNICDELIATVVCRVSPIRFATLLDFHTNAPELSQFHSAAANGNIDLVTCALSHGKPINSVFDGVLHAALSGGNPLVVKSSIEEQALLSELFCVVITWLSSNLAGSSIYLVGRFFFRG